MAAKSSAASDTSSPPTSCPVCHDEYDEPKLLPCAHRFCRKCLVTWFDSTSGRPSCPVCKRTIGNDGKRSPQMVENSSNSYSELPPRFQKNEQSKKSPHTSRGSSEKEALSKQDQNSEALVDKLPTDTILAALVDSAKKLRPPHLCSVCPSQKEAEDLCLHCGDMLCRGCSMFHSRLKATCHHEVKTLSGLTAEQLARNAGETCSSHNGQLLELYCPADGQLLCLLCFAVNHSQCGGVETIADAAKRQRQVVQSQIQRLAEASTSLQQASADIKQRQQELSESQLQCRRQVSVILDRLSSAVKARNDQLLKKVEEAPVPLKTKLQQQKQEVDESKWLVSANQQLVSDSLQSASDVNFLRVSGSLAARAARLSADVTQPANLSPKQRAVLDVDQYDVLRVEELLRNLGTVQVVTRDQTEAGGVVSPLPRAKKAAGAAVGAVVSVFDPLRCSVRRISDVPIRDLEYGDTVFCKAGSEMVLFADRKTKSLFLLYTFHPYDYTKIATLTCALRETAYLQEGLVALTTDTTSLYLIDVAKQPAGLTNVSIPELYTAIAPGLHNTIIVSPDNKPGTLDVIDRRGHLLKTICIEDSDFASPTMMCRRKNRVLLLKSKKPKILQIRLTANDPKNLYFPCPFNPIRLFVDHLDNVYITNDYVNVSVMNTKGDWRNLDMNNYGGIVVTEKGKAFTGDCSPGGREIPVLVYDLTND